MKIFCLMNWLTNAGNFRLTVRVYYVLQGHAMYSRFTFSVVSLPVILPLTLSCVCVCVKNNLPSLFSFSNTVVPKLGPWAPLHCLFSTDLLIW